MIDVEKTQLVKLGLDPKIGQYAILGEIAKVEEIKPLEIGNNCNIRSHSVLYCNTIIGDNFQTGHNVLIRENNKIGNNVSIGSHSVLERDIVIENNVRIHSNVFIPEYTHLEEKAWVGPNVVMTNAYHPLCPKVKECMKGPTIKKGAIVGANTTLLPYVTIGEGAFVGAGSLVTKDVPEGMVAFGSPAKIIKKVKDLECITKILDSNPYLNR